MSKGLPNAISVWQVADAAPVFDSSAVFT